VTSGTKEIYFLPGTPSTFGLFFPYSPPPHILLYLPLSRFCLSFSGFVRNNPISFKTIKSELPIKTFFP
jgi:hypothetical protein